MKKKITLLLLALVCTLCCALGLTACNDDSSKTVAVESITLDKTELTLKVGAEETLSVTYTPDNATEKSVLWSSSAPAIASIDNAGKITAKSAGTATITATTANSKTATCEITVTSGVSGNTYVVTDVIGNLSEDKLTELKEAYADTTLIFGADNSVTLSSNVGAFIQTGTYRQEDEILSITITEAKTNDGEAIDGFEPTTVECTFDGEKIILPLQILESFDLIFTVQVTE